jgi:uncharacterized RDD family membrane protein YckC
MTPAARPPTPKQVTAAGHDYTLAGWWRRAGGWLLDALILSIPVLAIQAVLGASLYSDPGAFGLGGHPTAGSLARITLNVVALLADLVYAAWLIGRRGQTVGMLAVGIIAIDPQRGSPLGMSKAWKRAIAAFLLTTLWTEWVFLSGFGHAHTNHPAPAQTILTLLGITLVLLTYLWPLGSSRNQTLQDKAVGSLIVLKSRSPRT